MKKKLFALLFISFAIFISSFTTIKFLNSANNKVIVYADFPSYNTIGEIKNNSSDIIKGKILKSKVEKLDLAENIDSTDPKLNPSYGAKEKPSKEDSMFICTVYEVKVIDVIKGNLKKNDIIKVKELGGSFEGKNYVLEGTKYMGPQKDYILFLEGYDNPDIPYSPLNPSQGSMEVSDKKIKVNENNSLFKNAMTEDEAINLIKNEE